MPCQWQELFRLWSWSCSKPLAGAVPHSSSRCHTMPQPICSPYAGAHATAGFQCVCGMWTEADRPSGRHYTIITASTTRSDACTAQPPPHLQCHCAPALTSPPQSSRPRPSPDPTSSPRRSPARCTCSAQSAATAPRCGVTRPCTLWCGPGHTQGLSG